MADNSELRQTALDYAQDLVAIGAESDRLLEQIKTCSTKTLYKITQYLINK